MQNLKVSGVIDSFYKDPFQVMSRIISNSGCRLSNSTRHGRKRARKYQYPTFDKQIQLWTALRILNFNKNELCHNTFYEIQNAGALFKHQNSMLDYLLRGN